MSLVKQWTKPVLVILVSFMIAWLLPSGPLDPWDILSLKKAAYMVFALAFIQAFGSAMIQLLGNRKGAILTGFFGGLISSTATTVSLARKSKLAIRENVGKETLTFLSATIAMLIEGMVLLLLGTTEIHLSLLLIFLGPILMTALIIVLLSRKLHHRRLKIEHVKLDILPILKLAAYIVAILSLSKLLQNVFGQSGLLILTFLVSLFEIHGSVIANIQLRDAGAFSVQFLGGLLAISVAASYLSKLFLIQTIGSSALRNKVFKYTAFLFLSLTASWVIFLFVA
jgi:uncharacterized membrane protein (DUF4010 family)